MAVITLPALQAQSMTLQLVRGDVSLEFFGGSEAIIASTKALWVISMKLRSMKAGTGGRAWFAALTQLSNLENTTKISAGGLVLGSGYAGANPLVAGAGQLGLTLSVDGATPSTVLGLAGDPIEVNGEFKILTSTATANVGGACTMEFEPALRQSPADNAPVNVKTPQLTVRSISPTADLSALLTGHYDMSLSFIESFRV